jgi:hypothetical protein
MQKFYSQTFPRRNISMMTTKHTEGKMEDKKSTWNIKHTRRHKAYKRTKSTQWTKSTQKMSTLQDYSTFTHQT